MSNELRGYSGGWKLEDALKEHAFSLELAYWINELISKDRFSFSFVDIGCGPAFYSAFIERHNKNAIVYACDANPLNEISFTDIAKIDISKKDYIADYYVHTPPFDIALCLEVGEHIEPEHEATVLDNIANSATKKIIMSWAIPGQGGFGHVNCRENDYIIAQMEARGWKHNPEESDFLRARCSGCDWFKNTIMVFDK